jgi:Sulfotransferase domain
MRLPGHRGSAGALPNLVIIGAMKSGTTSLHAYLDQHPAVAMSNPKEIHYFTDRNAHRPVDWYMAHFDADAAVRGEASPGYTKFPHRPGVPERMHRLIPDARLIYIVRDPVTRTVSQWLHEYLRHRDDRPLDEALADFRGNVYVDQSRYAYQLERYLPHYPLERIHVMTTESLEAKPRDALRAVTDFLELEPFEFDVATKANVADRRARTNRLGRILEAVRTTPTGRHLPRPLVALGKRARGRLSRRVARPALEASLHEALSDELRDDVQRLRTLTGLRLEEWSL